jgi:hypothetical protein
MSKKSEYQVKVKQDWNDFVVNMNKDFFDTNKLYVKSLVDYKTKNYVKPLDYGFDSSLPKLNPKLRNERPTGGAIESGEGHMVSPPVLEAINE